MPEGLTADDERTWRLKEWMRIEDSKKFLENARFDAEFVQERLREGFKMRFGRMVYGRWRENVQEKGPLRSDLFGLPGQMLVASCPKGGNLRTSWDKASLGIESRSKLLSLDLPYLEGNKEFLAFWRIDLDGIWPDIYAFKDDIRQLVGSKIPFAPHLVAGDELLDGRFSKPHLYFLLPPGEAVWNKPEDPRCKMRIVKFFEAVYFGIVDALKGLHADPGAPATTQRGKNPLSPLSTGFTMNERDFASMSEWAGWVDTNLNCETLVRTRAAEKAGVNLETSNSIFTALQKEAYRILRRWHFDADPRLRAPEGTIADSLHQALEPVAQELVFSLPGRHRMSEEQVALLVSRVATYAAGSFDPARLEKQGIIRKALLHVVDGLKTVRERQQVAAGYASREKAETTLARLLEAWDAMAVETIEITKSALARKAGVSRTTVQSRWSDLQAALASQQRRPVRCIDKRPSVGPVTAEPQTTTAQHWNPVEAMTMPGESYDGPDHCSSPPAPSHCVRVGILDSNLGIRLPISLAGPSPVAVIAVEVWPRVESLRDDRDSDDDDLQLLAEQESFLAAAMDSDDWDEPEPPEWPSDTVLERPTAHCFTHSGRHRRIAASLASTSPTGPN